MPSIHSQCKHIQVNIIVDLVNCSTDEEIECWSILAVHWSREIVWGLAILILFSYFTLCLCEFCYSYFFFLFITLILNVTILKRSFFFHCIIYSVTYVSKSDMYLHICVYWLCSFNCSIINSFWTISNLSLSASLNPTRLGLNAIAQLRRCNVKN